MPNNNREWRAQLSREQSIISPTYSGFSDPNQHFAPAGLRGWNVTYLDLITLLSSALLDFGKIKRKHKLQIQGAQILRNEAYLQYAAVTKDAAQRRSWTFYEAVKIEYITVPFTIGR
jgi:hypothetical protein